MLGAVLVVVLPTVGLAMGLVLAGVLVWARLRQEDVQALTALATGFLVAVVAYVVLDRGHDPRLKSAGLTALHRADRAQRHQQPRAGSATVSASTKSLPDPGQHDLVPGAAPRGHHAGAPSSASRRRADPRPSLETADQATSGTARSETPSAETIAPRGTSQSPASPATRHQPVPTRRSSPRTGPAPSTSSSDVAAHRGHQPAGQGDRGVLGPAAVSQLRVALGGVQRLGLPLEVVEEVEEPLVPTHAVEPATPQGLWRSPCQHDQSGLD